MIERKIIPDEAYVIKASPEARELIDRLAREGRSFPLSNLHVRLLMEKETLMTIQNLCEDLLKRANMLMPPSDLDYIEESDYLIWPSRATYAQFCRLESGMGTDVVVLVADSLDALAHERQRVEDEARMWGGRLLVLRFEQARWHRAGAQPFGPLGR